MLPDIAQHVAGKQIFQRKLPCSIISPTSRKPLPTAHLIGDEPHRAAGALQPAGQQHAQRLMRQPALKRITRHVITRRTRKSFHQQTAFIRHARNFRLQAKPLRDLRG